MIEFSAEAARRFGERIIDETATTFRTGLHRVMTDAVRLVGGAVVSHTPVGIGGPRGLRNNIIGKVSSEADELVGRVTVNTNVVPLIKALSVEHGSRPHWPPVEPIRQWVLVKFNSEEPTWAVRRKIAERGTPEFRMFQTAYDETRDDVVGMFHAFGREVQMWFESSGGD